MRARIRSCHVCLEHNGKRYTVSINPWSKRVTIRKYKSRKVRSLSLVELIEIADGQTMLPI